MTGKNKNIMLVLGFLLLLFLSYQLAIKNTFELRTAYKDLKKQELLFKNAPKQLSLLKQKEVYYDSLLTAFQIDGSSIQNNLLKTINSFSEANDLKVISFLEPHVIEETSIVVKTYEFVIEGYYDNINQLVYHLEQKTRFGEVVNLHFEKKKNYRTGRYYLQAKVLLRSFG